MPKTIIKSITEERLQPENHAEKTVSIVFETEQNGQIKSGTITLTGSGSLKSAALV